MFDRFVRFGARIRPYHPAVSNGQAHVTYRQLDREVDQVAVALRQASLAGAVIGVATRDGYRHALLTLACARLGFGTASLLPGMVPGMAALAGVDAIVSDDPALGGAGVVADDAWFQATLTAAHNSVPAPRLDPEAIARVQLSSGTTGVPKAVAISWALQHVRENMSPGYHGLAARTLSMIGPESGGFGSWALTWRSLGTVLVGSADVGATAAMLPVLAPRMLVASPAQVAALLTALAADAAPLLEPLIVVGAGGRIVRRQREQLALRLGASVVSSYASTEAGTVAVGFASQSADDGDAGYLMPGVEVEALDVAGRPLPPGEVGLLRIRSNSVAAGYRDGPGQAFRDGWFHPGDVGAVSADSALRVLGRADEVMNLGGEKFAPESLEEPVRAVPGVADIAAFALEDAAGVPQPWLAIVRGGEVDEAAIGRALALPNLGTVRIAWIDAIPRTAMGKPRREELKAAARRLGG